MSESMEVVSLRLDPVLDEVRVERVRQEREEGFSPAHDDAHEHSELAVAAASYALFRASGRSLMAESIWPFGSKVWKPKDARRDLVRSAALIVAEIERLDRATANAPAPNAALDQAIEVVVEELTKQGSGALNEDDLRRVLRKAMSGVVVAGPSQT